MGLVKVAGDAVGGVLADQWREFFYCDAIDSDVLVVKGRRRQSGRSSNTKGSDNIISDGSVIAVAGGQSMIIVEQGKIVEFSAEPGEFIFDSSKEPSIFAGNLGDSVLRTFSTMAKRFTFGGEAPHDQRVYYFNMKEMFGNKYGTANPVPFRVVDQNIGLDVDISIRCFGEYTYRIYNPMLFFQNVCGNIVDPYTRDKIDAQMKTEVLTALQPAFARISEMGIRYSALPGHTTELTNAMNEVLTQQWKDTRGLEMVSFGVSSIRASNEDEDMIKELQRNATLRNPTMAAAHLVSAQADAMKAAASNESGAMTGFLGMGMAGAAGGINANQLFQQAQQMQQPVAAAAAPQAQGWKCSCGATVTGKFCPECGAQKPEPKAADSWVCSCGHENIGKFCSECGAKRPEEAAGWKCACGSVNKGRFCPNCGARKPAGVPQYRCDKCGWEPKDPENPPKFCPECGDPFGDEDVKE